MIRDCVARHAHAFDRCDLDLAKSVYWPEAIEHHSGSYSGPAYPWIEETFVWLRKVRAGWKLMSNPLIRLSGTEARVESYVLAVNQIGATGGEIREAFIGGRYLDRMTKRAGEWRIIERHAFIEWHSDKEELKPGTPFFGKVPDSGDFFPNDPSTEHFLGSL
jgi:hypothetical protein